MLKVDFLSFGPHPAEGYWDQTMLKDILASEVFKHFDNAGGALCVIPGEYQGRYIKDINIYLSRYKWVVLFITSDEGGNFPIEKITHQNMKVWIQYPKQGKHDQYRKWPLGYVADTRKNLFLSVKDLDYFFSGQITHERRREMAHKLKVVPGGMVNETEGFSQGMDQQEYMKNMVTAKIAPSPAGPISADAFRTYEALEAGAVPIADNISAAGDHDYWDYLFGSVPFPTINNYNDLPGYIADYLGKYPTANNIAQAWWIKKKRDLKQQIIEDIESVSGSKVEQTISIIIPVSPIKSHPSTEVLDETIQSVRHHFPHSEIIITFDGVRKEQEAKRADYEEFIRYALFRCNTDWDATPIVFTEHTHQVRMAREALRSVVTPLVLYVEQDTPLVIDEPIEWEYLFKEIMVNQANVIRFHFEAHIPREHKQLMLKSEGCYNLTRTIQWSQRPHIASTAFYRYILDHYFSENANCFIEDKMHGIVQQDYTELGERGWDRWKLFIYTPEGNIKRSLHSDGRAGEKKYDERQRF